MTENELLKSCFEGLKNGGRQAQLRWCTVQSVDKEKRIMDAKGDADGLEYYDIQLGMGAMNVYPKVGSSCLIAIVEGQEADAYLISAAEVDAIELTAEMIALNEGQAGGLVLVEKLAEKLNAIVEAFNKHTHEVVTQGNEATQKGTTQAPSGQAEKIDSSYIASERIIQ